MRALRIPDNVACSEPPVVPAINEALSLIRRVAARANRAREVHDLSQRRAAGLIPVEQASLRHKHHRDPQDALRVRLRKLAGSRVRYGYPRLTVTLKRDR